MTLSLHDYTGGTEPLKVLPIDSQSSFFTSFLGFIDEGVEANELRGSRRLNDSTLALPQPTIQASLLLPNDSPYRNEDGASVQMRLPNGDVEQVFLGKPTETSLQHLLQQLTIYRDGQRLTSAEVVNERIRVIYVGPDGDVPFEFHFDGLNVFTPWAGQFVPVGVFPSGVAEGLPLIPQLPSAFTVPINGETLVADILHNNLMRNLFETNGTVSITAELRCG